MSRSEIKDKGTAAFSLRIVTADYYMSPPIPDLDVTLSEFRGTEVSQVPVLRIFGSTPIGRKACLHVHGVFPYLYVPCEDSNPESKRAYLLANSIDKAINISLKQSNSQNQHVYKIVLVKGIPFYGYHSKNHQFYKIFFYNPYFVKRTADLLKSGGIMGLSYQPHEAHLNFVMQFFIDFNLYGMSFMNLEYVKFRKKYGNSLSQNLNDTLTFLPDTVQYTSRCEYELDCLAFHILNRREILNGGLGVNPGLEALWEDERKRHKNLHMSHEIPPTQSQSRENIPFTESHKYFMDKLKIKLVINSEINDKLQSSINESESENFDFTNSFCKDSLNTSVYPAETPDGNDLMNATNISLHHPVSSVSTNCTDSKPFESSSETIVNEEIVIKCSQSTPENIGLDNDDFQLMEMLKGMENTFEDDSILSIQSKELDNEQHQEENFSEIISNSTNQEDLSIKTSQNLLTQPLSWNDSFWDNVDNISQIDGAWDDEDEILHQRKRSKNVSKKIGRNKSEETIQSKKIEKSDSTFFDLENQFKIFENTPVKNLKFSPRKSPRKSPRNFTPLNKVIEVSPSKKQIISNSLDTSPICTTLKRKSHFKSVKNVKRKILSQKQSSTFNYDTSISAQIKNNTNNSLFKRHNSLNKSGMSGDKKISDDYNKSSNLGPMIKISMFQECENNNKNHIYFESQSQVAVHNFKSTKNITASQYDKQNDYIPQPGTSGIVKNVDNVENIDCSLPNTDEFLPNDREIISFYNATNYETSMFLNLSNNSENDITQLEPHEKSLLCNNSSVQKKLPQIQYSDSKCDIKFDFEMKSKLHSSDTTSEISSNSKKIVLCPKISPPTFFDILSTMEAYDIPKQRNPIPFYSDPKDIGAQIEIGQIILKLKGKQIKDLKEFESNLPNIESLIQQRKKIFLHSNITQNDPDLENLECGLTTARNCILIPVIKPPSAGEVKDWLHTLKSKNENQTSKENQQHKKIQILMPNSPDQDMENSQFDILSVSSCSQSSSKSDASKHDCLNINHVNIIKSSQHSNESDEIMCGQKSKDSFPVNDYISDFNHSQNILKNKNDQDRNNKLTEYVNEYLSISNAYKFSGDNYQDAEVYHENDYLTLLTIEILASTRGDLNPDPQHDSICALFYSILNNCPESHKLPTNETGFIIIDNVNIENKIDISKYTDGLSLKYNIIKVKNEEHLIEEVINIIYKWDPDILCGYEIEMLSWGFLIQRAFVMNINLPEKISRLNEENRTGFKKSISQDASREIKLVGRITLDVWRLLRHEVALTNYTFENVTYHVLHERFPLFSFKTLSFWWNHPSYLLRILCIEYYLTRVTGTIRILQQLDLIGRTSELAKLFGIQWYEVLSRGSQFRVESMMIRLTRTYNYVLVSPSVQQRAAMKAPECLPLILEPESRFYSDPVIVLDFQSLYPSMMIAYNYCYSTCIGKVNNVGKNSPYEFGASCLKVSPKILQKLSDKDLINWSPCGVGFVKSTVRKGILPTMLHSILSTRFMVKKAMKKYKNNKTLQKILHNRQLGLKLIANVTYGYTAANFSGRMPCVEVGDSVVAKGRETLERAIKIVENTPKWGAKVVYGDTDSLFVLLPGRNRFDAFEIGAEIAEVITNDNPSPVKLKLEKIYQPCILQTKKRYVGYKYESKDQISPEYEAKGIETVRRDGCPAASKILEKSLKILFETYDVSKVKLYVLKKFQNIIEDKSNILDFVFAKEFRGMNSYKPGASVPSLEIAKRLKLTDPRKEPREGERVPYVIINGAPGETLLNCTRRPQDLLYDPSLRINHFYYITRVIIPPLNRCFTLIGADVNLWLAEMPRKQVQLYPLLNSSGKQQDNKKNTISQYFTKVNCAGCDEQTIEGLCMNCIIKPQTTLLKLYNKMNSWQRNYFNLKKLCQSCCGRATQIDCVSIDCPIVFRLNTAKLETQQIPYLLQLKNNLLDF